EASPGGSMDQEAYFYPPPGIPILGGYAGIGALDPDARDIDLYETVLTGDLAGNDEPDFTNREDNSYSVVDCEEAFVDGCTITSGGRGFASDGLTITRSHLRENYCAIRGAMDGSGMHVSQCVFDHNAVGIIIDLDSATVEDCVFSNHSTWTIMGGESGLVAN